MGERENTKREFFFSQMSFVHVSLCFVLSLFLLSGSKPAYVISVVKVVLFSKTMVYFEKVKQCTKKKKKSSKKN